MLNKIKYPFALSKDTNELVPAKDVENGKKCNCYCDFCKEDLIAVNKKESKIRPHFRHQSDSICQANYETYLHWLSKRVFRTMRHIKLPPIKSYQLSDMHHHLSKELMDLFGKYNVKEELWSHFKKQHVQEITSLDFDIVETEDDDNTFYGDVRIDVVLKKGNDLLFIEPFVTHEIDDIKKEKLEKLDFSTIEIDLKSLVWDSHSVSSISKLKSFLINQVWNKSWIVIRKEKRIRLANQYLKKVEEQIRQRDEDIKSYNRNNQQIENIYDQQQDMYRKIQSLESKLTALQKNQKDLFK